MLVFFVVRDFCCKNATIQRIEETAFLSCNFVASWWHHKVASCFVFFVKRAFYGNFALGFIKDIRIL
nr:MAG TPA: hypothetical protein [Caudoviricetes sp.]